MDEPLSPSEGPRPERRQERRARIAGALDRDELVGAEDVDVIAALGDDALMRDYVYACVRLGAHLGPRERAFVLRGYTLAGLDRPPLPPEPPPPSQLRAQAQQPGASAPVPEPAPLAPRQLALFDGERDPPITNRPPPP